MNMSERSMQREAFAKRVRREIRRNGLTYDEVARRMREYLPADTRLSPVSVWSYANGRSTPRKPSYLHALSKVIGVDVEELVGQPDGPLAAEGIAISPLTPGADPTHSKVLQVVDLDGEQAYLQIQQEANWSVILEILKLLKTEESNDASKDRPDASADGEETPLDARHRQH